MPEALTVGEAVKLLLESYGPPEPPPTTDPFELLLLENVAYLAPPARRRDAFEHLKHSVGTDPALILKADRQALEAVTSRGILKATFATKLRECARIAIEAFEGDLNAVVRLPLGNAKRALRRFPGVGEPGAEKILLFSGQQALLAPESNGLRVLVRLGFVTEDKSYARMFAAARQVARELPSEIEFMKEAHLLLRRHGQTVCRRKTPHCDACVLNQRCPYAGEP